jgi:sodium/proline symporter
MVRKIFGVGALALFGGLLLSAIVAAAMSTADSQLLASSSAFASDIYKTAIKKDASDKEMLWVGRITVLVVTVVALLIALFGSADIMTLVSAAWSIFGAAFGPVILLSLFWRRFNYKGAVTGIITGFVVSILYMVLFNFEYYGFESLVYNTQVYEIVPGFIVGLIVSFVVSIFTKEPDKEVVDLFDSVKNGEENLEELNCDLIEETNSNIEEFNEIADESIEEIA